MRIEKYERNKIMKQTQKEWAKYIRDEIQKMYKTCYLVDCPMHQKLDQEENWKNKKIQKEKW